MSWKPVRPRTPCEPPRESSPLEEMLVREEVSVALQDLCVEVENGLNPKGPPLLPPQSKRAGRKQRKTPGPVQERGKTPPEDPELTRLREEVPLSLAGLPPETLGSARREQEVLSQMANWVGFCPRPLSCRLGTFKPIGVVANSPWVRSLHEALRRVDDWGPQLKELCGFLRELVSYYSVDKVVTDFTRQALLVGGLEGCHVITLLPVSSVP